jgi:hypothetical protein
MLDPGVVACARCQQPNWIPAGWSRDQLSCTHCGVALGAGPPPPPRPKRRFAGFLSQTFNAVGVAALCALPVAGRIAPPIASSSALKDTSRIPPSGPSRSAPPRRPATSALPLSIDPEPLRPGAPRPVAQDQPRVRPPLSPTLPPTDPAGPSPVAIAEGIVSKTMVKPALIPFQVHAAAGNDYFVKLVNASNATEIITLFIRAGSTLKLSMPIGSYRLSFAAGDKWYGEVLKFGPQTTYWTSRQMLVFSRGATVAIELPERRAVPARSVPLDPRKF